MIKKGVGCKFGLKLGINFIIEKKRFAVQISNDFQEIMNWGYDIMFP